MYRHYCYKTPAEELTASTDEAVQLACPFPLDQLQELTIQVKEISMEKHGLLTEVEIHESVDRFPATGSIG